MADPDFPSLVAIMVALPGATPVTTPAADTVAIEGALLDHITTRPVSTVPLASRVVALNVTLWPIAVDADDGATVTVATGTFATVTVAEPMTPSIVALMTAAPDETAVTIPAPETVATPGDPLDQVTVRPLIG